MTSGPTTSSPGVRLEWANRRADIVLSTSNPGNPIDVRVAHGLRRVVELLAEQSPDVVVVRAEGPNFSFGGDLGAFDRAPCYPDYIDQVLDDFHMAVQALHAFDAPTVCAVHGWIVGGAIGLATACDIVVCAESASFKYPYGRLGLTPDGGSVWHLARALAPTAVLNLLASECSLSAPEAKARGLVARVVAEEDLLSEVEAVVNEVTSVPRPVWLAWRFLVREASETTLPEHLHRERRLMVQAASTQDAHDRLRAVRGR